MCICMCICMRTYIYTHIYTHIHMKTWEALPCMKWPGWPLWCCGAIVLPSCWKHSCCCADMLLRLCAVSQSVKLSVRHRPCVVQQLFKRKNCVPKWKETQQVRRVPKCELHVRCACINHWAFLLKAMLFQFGLCVFWSCASQLLETLFQQHPTTSKKLRVFSIGMFYFNNLGMFHPNILDMFFIVFYRLPGQNFMDLYHILATYSLGSPNMPIVALIALHVGNLRPPKP